MENTIREAFSYDLIPLRIQLPEIRLLELFPAPDFTDDLWCRLYTDSGGPFETPSYCALSYAWGNGTKSHEIFTTKPAEATDREHGASLAGPPINGSGLDDNPERESLSIPITASLDSCLRQLRSFCELGPLTIWIDQICINQSNDQEKSAQVELMRKIYSSAQQVFIWLGPTADGSDDVMDAHAHVAEIFREHYETGALGDHGDAPQQYLVAHFIKCKGYWLQPSFQHFIDEVVRIYAPLIRDHKLQKWLSREWFSRVWVKQELSLSRDAVFVCGNKPLKAVQLYVSALLFQGILYPITAGFPADLPKMTTDILRPLATSMSLFDWLFDNLSAITAVLWWQLSTRLGEGDRSLFELLKRLYTNPTCESISSKYRDRIYGLIGLASDADDLDLRPDYSDQTRTTMILTQTARALIEKGHAQLEVLSMAQFPKRGVREMEDGLDEQFPLPSWVPDWYNGLRTPYRGGFGQALRSSSASLNTSVQVVPTVFQSTLGLRGFLVDTIEEVGSYTLARESSGAAADDYYAECYDPLCSVKQFWHQSVKKKHSIDSHAPRQNKAFWRIPIGDIWLGSESKGGPIVEIRPPSELGAHIFEQALQFCKIRMSIRQQWTQHAIPDVEFKPILSQAEQEIVQHAKDREGLLFDYLGHLKVARTPPYLTKKGYLGLAPLHTQPGDLIVIFSGGKVPYVIRPVTTDTDRYRPDENDNIYTFVGEAYCDGIMDGEFMERAGEIQDFFLV
ncbi:heterokaryon incompatibility protein-domain-containing protein [Copromyces sp. CBS 386.78]|nr:heterokaryon incompatibility protein-domain-containing protein [Copromyces sp. CBS 386.78]